MVAQGHGDAHRHRGLQHAGDGKVSLLDGIKVVSGESWVQILPDADEPVFHVYAEGASSEQSEELAEQFVGRVRDVIEGHQGT